MKGQVKRKVVSSGRLTGAVKADHLTVGAASTEPAYSLYSTDSEDQVTTLHKGLDRCAALLGGIRQGKKAGSPSFPRMVKSVGAKSRLSASLGKKTIKKPPTKTAQNQKSSPSATTTPPAHSGVKLHLPQKQPHAPLQGPSHGLSCTVPPPQTSVLLSVHQTSSLPLHHPDSQRSQTKAELDGEQEAVPVRDVKIQSPEADRKDAHGGEVSGADARVKTVQYLLSELRTLITGQGSVAEKLLSHLEQTVSSTQTNIQTECAQELSSLQSHNAQLRRRVKILNQQLKEREKVEKRQNLEMLCTSDAFSLQEELFMAQSRLQELQDDLAGLRKSLQDTQSQLRDKEAENALLKSELEATRSRLMNSEREKSEPASSRLLQSSSVHCPSHGQRAQDPPALSADRVTQYLLSLGPPMPADVRVAAEKEDKSPPSNPGIATRPEEELNSTLSQCDVESVCSDWSMRSGSSFNTRDEAAFRDGLAALDASIASLQKTIQLEMRR